MLTNLDVWPLSGLRLRTPRLELRPISDEDIVGMANAAAAGIHADDQLPFMTGWSTRPPKELGIGAAQNVWELRASLSPDAWSVNFAIVHDDQIIGRQDVAARQFNKLRTVGTGSWLTLDMQGQGFGTEMRAAVLLWAFDYLKARYALTGAFDWNEASKRVSLSLGYEMNGEQEHVVEGKVERELKMRVSPETLIRPEWTLTVEGNEAVVEFLEIEV